MPEENPPTSSGVTSIYSETALLQDVIVHTPGEEMELVSPYNRLDLLFDDILFLSEARREHQLMCGVFEKIIGTGGSVLQVSDLLRDVFQLEDARREFVELLCRTRSDIALQAFESELLQFSPDELHRLALTGRSPLPIDLQPLPNLIFTRDLAAAVGDHFILSHAAKLARVRESILFRAIIHQHPRFESLKEHLIELPDGVTFEGGDLLVVDEETVLIGHSERTSLGGVLTIAQELFRRTAVQNVLMVDLPKRRYCMHLDTVFTFTSPSEAVYFPPIIGEGDLEGSVVHLTRGNEPDHFDSRVLPSLKHALAEVVTHEITHIPCGGHERHHQEREQWTDGANFFAIAPGVVIGYERNRRTFEMMQEHGYRVVSTEGFMSFYEQSEFVPGEKIAIMLEGNELSRGRGGPRCMTLPLRRHPIGQAS